MQPATMSPSGTAQLVDRKTWEAAQVALLRSHITDLHQRSPWYRNLFAANGINPADLRTLADLATFPFTVREQLEKHNDRFLAVPANAIRDHATTSGTMGQPVPLPQTEHDLQRLARNEEGSLRLAGVTASDTVQLMTTIDKRFMAGLAYQMGVRAIGAAMVRMGPGDAAGQWDAIARFKPTVLIAVPSFVLRMLEHAQRAGIDPRASSVRTIVCIGEPVTNAEQQPNALAARINEHWPVTLLSTYASTEMCTASTEREPCGGAVVQSGLIHVEIVDDQDRPLPMGEPGEVIATPFGVEGMPLLRYRTGDICTQREAHGPNGYELRLGPVLGRKQQRLKIKGTTVFPAQVLDALAGCREVSNYVALAGSDELGQDTLKVLVDTPEAQLPPVLEQLRSRLRVAPVVECADTKHIDTLATPTGARKPQRFIDQRAQR
ncbi:MAG: AMP-binding protein [Flavobacteriales bacterium]|nr:AMP-binding protein [Flavobacteriales bacterium]